MIRGNGSISAAIARTVKASQDWRQPLLPSEETQRLCDAAQCWRCCHPRGEDDSRLVSASWSRLARIFSFNVSASLRAAAIFSCISLDMTADPYNVLLCPLLPLRLYRPPSGLSDRSKRAARLLEALDCPPPSASETGGATPELRWVYATDASVRAGRRGGLLQVAVGCWKEGGCRALWSVRSRRQLAEAALEA